MFLFCFVAAADKRRSCQKKVITRSLQSANKLKICENVNPVVLRTINCPHMFMAARDRPKKIAQSRSSCHAKASIAEKWLVPIAYY